MKKYLLLFGISLWMTISPHALSESIIHAVSDLGHSFSFYADGRFKTQYFPDQKHQMATSWGNLYDYDASNVNLLIFLGCNPNISYSSKDIAYVRKFLSEGGAVLILGQSDNKPQNKFLQAFGASFHEAAKPPLNPTKFLKQATTIEGNNFSTLSFPLNESKKWTPLIVDSADKPVLSFKKVGKGVIIAGSRSLAGSNPDATKDPINNEWWGSLLELVVGNKKIDPSKKLESRRHYQQGNMTTIDGVDYHYSDYLESTFRAMASIQQRCRPAIQKCMGVPLYGGMGNGICLLASGDGGFANPPYIALAVFWDNFPAQEEGMIELISHETVHVWVLPHPEVWNEPIATYVGNLVMMDMGYADEGLKRIKHTISRATKYDEDMTKYDLQGHPAKPDAPELNSGQKNDIHWGKTFWIFEELRKLDPNFMAKYFQAKRKFVPVKANYKYTIDDTVAVMSQALGKDLFPWFKEHGIDADRTRVQLSFDKENSSPN